MAIHKLPSNTAKYIVVVSNGKNLPPALQKQPTLCSFFGAGEYATTKKEAYDLAKFLYKKHPNRVYTILTLNYSDNSSNTFGE